MAAIRVLLTLLLLAMCAPCTRAGDDDDPDAPPAVGQPEDFSGIVGICNITTRITSSEVYVEEPLTLVVSIKDRSSLQKYRPQRDSLQLFPPDFEKNFFVEPLPQLDRYKQAAQTWDFAYRLRPKSIDVNAVPGLKLSYYHAQLKRYQAVYSRPLKLTVKPKPPPQLEDKVDALTAPAFIYELTVGQAVLARRGADWLHWLGVAAALLAPPLGCALWLGLVAWRYPDEHVLARRRRSRAARQALQALAQTPADPTGKAVLGIVLGYLHARLDLTSVEPTPAELAEVLTRHALSEPAQQQLTRFAEGCAAARFAPHGLAVSTAFPAQAAAAIHTLENELCMRR